jgi:hypothetical protein
MKNFHKICVCISVYYFFCFRTHGTSFLEKINSFLKEHRPKVSTYTQTLLQNKFSSNIDSKKLVCMCAAYKLFPAYFSFFKSDEAFFGLTQGIGYFPNSLKWEKKQLRLGFFLLENRTYTIIPNYFLNIFFSDDEMKEEQNKILWWGGLAYGIIVFPLSLSLVCLEWKYIRFSFFALGDLLRLVYIMTTHSKLIKQPENISSVEMVFSFWFYSPSWYSLDPDNDRKIYKMNFHTPNIQKVVPDKYDVAWGAVALCVLLPRISIDLSDLIKNKDDDL